MTPIGEEDGNKLIAAFANLAATLFKSYVVSKNARALPAMRARVNRHIRECSINVENGGLRHQCFLTVGEAACFQQTSSEIL
jgi:hypothetical protein